MQFNLPTTKQKMYDTLNDIFYYYRVKRASFEDIALKELDLARLSHTPPTDEQLLLKAKALVLPEQRREILERKRGLEEDVIKIQSKITSLENSLPTQIENVESLYQQSKSEVEKQAVKNGLISSGVLVNKFAALEEGKNEKILKINADYQAQVDALNAELLAKTTALENVENDFLQAHATDVDKKFIELKQARQDKIDEVFKYNNGLDEKEQRYKNTILQANANLELKFLEINSGEFSKDQLVEMGYYNDVIRCVCGYFDTLNAGVAYQQVNTDQKLPIYLDDYYANIVYMYQSKAGV